MCNVKMWLGQWPGGWVGVQCQNVARSVARWMGVQCQNVARSVARWMGGCAMSKCG